MRGTAGLRAQGGQSTRLGRTSHQLTSRPGRELEAQAHGPGEAHGGRGAALTGNGQTGQGSAELSLGLC